MSEINLVGLYFDIKAQELVVENIYKKAEVEREKLYSMVNSACAHLKLQNYGASALLEKIEKAIGQSHLKNLRGGK